MAPASYQVELRPSVLKRLRSIPRKDLRRLKIKIEEIALNPPDHRSTKMKGENPFHRVRSGHYRIIYEIQENRLVILIVRIGHRKDVYKKIR